MLYNYVYRDAHINYLSRFGFPLTDVGKLCALAGRPSDGGASTSGHGGGAGSGGH